MRILDTRDDFGHLCNEHGFRTAYEIGTHQGVFADVFLSCFSGNLICVDPWSSAVDERGVPFTPSFVPNVVSAELNHAIASTVLCGKYPNRVVLLRTSWREHASGVNDQSLEFVYLDPLHSLSETKGAILAYWSKIKPGGILAGHDYSPLDPTLVGVAVAVNWFAANCGLDLCLTKDELPSWYIQKPA